MPLSRLSLPLLLSAAMLLAVAADAWADPPTARGAHRPQATSRPQAAPRLRATSRAAATPRPDANEALSDSVRRIQRTTQGQVLSAERVPFDGRSIHRIKVIDDRGRVRVYMDDPQSPHQSPTRDDDD